jgi:hypothetical protein
MIGQLVLAGLTLIPGIKEQGTLLTEADTAVDPVWKTKLPGGTIEELPFDLYVIEDANSGAATAGGIDLNEEMEFLAFIPIKVGQHFERSTGENFQVIEYEALPGVSKELYLGTARRVTTGQRS